MALPAWQQILERPLQTNAAGIAGRNANGLGPWSAPASFTVAG